MVNYKNLIRTDYQAYLGAAGMVLGPIVAYIIDPTLNSAMVGGLGGLSIGDRAGTLIDIMMM